MVEATLSDQRELASAIRLGARRGPHCFGSYFDDHGGSCALGAAYEGMYVIPRDHGVLIPKDLNGKRIPLAAMIVHLNDDHHWTREQIADWLANGESNS